MRDCALSCHAVPCRGSCGGGGSAFYTELLGWTTESWSLSTATHYFAETPGGTSVATVAHWMQHAVLGDFSEVWTGAATTPLRSADRQTDEPRSDSARRDAVAPTTALEPKGRGAIRSSAPLLRRSNEDFK